MGMAAFWLARWAALKAMGWTGLGAWAWQRAASWVAGASGWALLIAAAMAAVLFGVMWLRSDARSTAFAARDSFWREQIAAASVQTLQAQADLAAKAQTAAEEERARLEKERDAAVEDAASLERALAKERSKPKVADTAKKDAAAPDETGQEAIAFPRDIAKSLSQ